MTPLERLAMADRLLTPQTFCCGDMAQDANGNVMHVGDPGAVRWCLMGAFRHNEPIDSVWWRDKCRPTIDMLASVSQMSLERLNDSRGYEAVKDLLFAGMTIIAAGGG